MTKCLEIYPDKLFAKGEIDFTPIPVCAYDKTPAQEKKMYSKDDFVTIYHDMVVLRTFETVINELKLHGEYDGVKELLYGDGVTAPYGTAEYGDNATATLRYALDLGEGKHITLHMDFTLNALSEIMVYCW